MILFILVLGLWEHFNNYYYYQDYWGFTFLPYLIFFGFILLIILFLFILINKRLKELPGNDDRLKVFQNTWIASFISTIALIIILSIVYRGYTFLYFEEFHELFVMMTIFIACWMLFFILIQSLVEIPKQKKYYLFTILWLLGSTTLLSFFISYAFFGLIAFYLNESYVGLFAWSMPFVISSIIIGYLGYSSLKIKVNEIEDVPNIFYTRSTNYLLLLSLPILLIPLATIFNGRFDYIYQFIFDYDYDILSKINIYYIGVYGSVTYSTCCVSIFIILIIVVYSASRIHYEKKYKIHRSKRGLIKKELLKNKLGLMVFLYYFVTILIITSLAVAYMEPTFEKSIHREFHGQNEVGILHECEEIDFGKYFNLSLFQEHYEENVIAYSKYEWYTFINNSAINDFSDKMNHNIDNNNKVHAWLFYEAKVYPFGDYQIDYYGRDRENVNQTTGFQYYGLDVVINRNLVYDLSIGDHYMYSKDFVYPQTPDDIGDFQVVEQGYHFDFRNSYMVKMSLFYSAYHPPDYQYFNQLNQIIVMDEGFSVKLILFAKADHYIYPYDPMDYPDYYH